jgi:ABC-2 type transport system ATP-binding protein
VDAVHTFDITKRFGNFCAVDHVNLQIGHEVFGMLGPNGAGKTTLARMLTTVLPPTEGTAVVAGTDIRTEPDKVRRRIGVVTQATTLDFELSAYENMDIYGQYFDVPRQLRKERINSLLEVVGLADRANSLVGGFSGGMKRRLEIVRSLVHEPEMLFLDEPTTGLDPVARAAVWEYLVKLHKDQGITLIITTHFMDEAEGLCDRLVIVDHGKIVALGNPEELKRQVSKGDIIEADFSSAPETALNALKSADFVLDIKRQSSLLTIHVNNGAEAIPKIIEITDANGSKVRTIALREITMDDVVLNYTGRSLRE